MKKAAGDHTQSGIRDDPVSQATPLVAAHVPSPLIVPIRSLGDNHRSRIAAHLLALEPRDRYLRFGYSASDDHIHKYANDMDFVRDEVFGIYNRKMVLIAMAHLAYPAEVNRQSCVEFGVSVLKSGRHRGYGARLFDRAAMHARNDGITKMIIHTLSENTPMLRIVRAAGAVVRRDGPESEAYLIMPEPTLDSRLSEIVHQQWALADYHLKERVHQFESMLARLSAVPITNDGADSASEL